MIREPLGHTVGNEDQPTDLPAGIGHHYYSWSSYEGTIILIFMLLYIFVHITGDNMIREQVGPTAGNEDQPTDFDAGIGQPYYIWNSFLYDSIVLIFMLLKQI